MAKETSNYLIVHHVIMLASGDFRFAVARISGIGDFERAPDPV
jgi:hypothetical protein